MPLYPDRHISIADMREELKEVSTRPMDDVPNSLIQQQYHILQMRRASKEGTRLRKDLDEALRLGGFTIEDVDDLANKVKQYESETHQERMWRYG